MKRLVAVLTLSLFACGAHWTDADRDGDLAAESMLSRLYALDAGPQVNAYSRAGLCSVQQNLERHDAGRLVGPVQCTPTRAP